MITIREKGNPFKSDKLALQDEIQAAFDRHPGILMVAAQHVRMTEDDRVVDAKRIPPVFLPDDSCFIFSHVDFGYHKRSILTRIIEWFQDDPFNLKK